MAVITVTWWLRIKECQVSLPLAPFYYFEGERQELYLSIFIILDFQNFYCENLSIVEGSEPPWTIIN